MTYVIDAREKIIEEIANNEVEKICNKVINHFTKTGNLNIVDNSILKNAWDEICILFYSCELVNGDQYDEAIYGCIIDVIKNMPLYILQAIWLQTDEGIDWLCDDEQREEDEEVPPVYLQDVILYIKSKVLAKADNWSNCRIRRYKDIYY